MTNNTPAQSSCFLPRLAINFSRPQVTSGFTDSGLSDHTILKSTIPRYGYVGAPSPMGRPKHTQNWLRGPSYSEGPVRADLLRP